MSLRIWQNAPEYYTNWKPICPISSDILNGTVIPGPISLTVLQRNPNSMEVLFCLCLNFQSNRYTLLYMSRQLCCSSMCKNRMTSNLITTNFHRIRYTSKILLTKRALETTFCFNDVNEHHELTNHRQLDCLFNRKFRTNENSIKALHYMLFARWHSPMTGRLLSQRTSHAGGFSVSWRRHTPYTNVCNSCIYIIYIYS